MKPGFRTTEFWGTAFVHLLTLFLASGVLPESHWAVKAAAFAASALAQLGYSYGRGLSKSTGGK
jgi:hypothetical protein